MKKTNFKKFLLLFCILASVFCMTACTDTISNNSAKESIKKQEVVGNQRNLAIWANDMIIYLDHSSDDQIKSDAENAITLDNISGVDYKVNSKGMTNKTVEFYNGWTKSRKDLGSLVSINDVSITISDTTGELCTVNVDTTFEKRKCTFSFVMDDDVNLTSGAINPVYTTGEKVEKALLNTVIGMGTVFIVLIFISFIISLLKHVNKIGAKKEETTAQTQAQPQQAAVAEVEENNDDEVDDLELVAVITAAIAASENTSADGLVVRSIRKVNKTNNWKR
jgi:sodium pump decarboxylase gamma subunit